MLLKNNTTITMVNGFVLVVIMLLAGSAEAAWDRHDIETSFSRAVGVSTGDFNGDGLIDIVASDHAPETFRWYENTGSGFTPHTVVGPYGSGGFKEVVAVDLDHDGDDDFVTTADEWEAVTWWRNDGSGNFSQVTMDGNLLDADNLDVGDVDNNGLTDVVASGRNQRALYLQTSPGTFTKSIIHSGTGVACQVFLVDFDGDNSLDMLLSDNENDRIKLYLNDGAESFGLTATIPIHDAASDVKAADIDEDGDIDIIATEFNGDYIAWYENLGGYSFSGSKDVISGVDAPYKLLVMDVDNDGHLDIVSGLYYTGGISWWQNDGNGNFSGGIEIDASFTDANFLWAEDMNGDGSLDVLCAGLHHVSWFENPEGGTPSDEPRYEVVDNQILDRNHGDKPLMIRGIDYGSLAWDPESEWGNPDIQYILDKMRYDWHANTIRVALNEANWLNDIGETGYRSVVDHLVNVALDMDLHVILDLHYIGGNDLIENDANGAILPMPWEQSIEFWSQVAGEYKDEPKVFFEVYNEPHQVSTRVWKNGNWDGNQMIPANDSIGSRSYEPVGMQELVDVIRDSADNLILVGGLKWAYDLSHVLDEQYRIEGQGIVYATHVYEFPGKLPDDWYRAFGEAAEHYPVVATEFGDLATLDANATCPEECDNIYTQAFLRYAKERNIGFTAWEWRACGTTGNLCATCNDPRFHTLITNRSGSPTLMGLPVKQALMWFHDHGTGIDPSVWPDESSYYFHSYWPYSLHVTKQSPVDIAIQDPLGRWIWPYLTEVPGTAYHTYEITAGDTGAIVMIPHHEDGQYLVQVLPWQTASPGDSYTLFASTSLDTQFLAVDCAIGDIPPDGYLFSTLDTGSVNGVVACEGAGLNGVSVDLYDSVGVVIGSAVTDESGAYEFAALDNGIYSISIATPLGYQAVEETQEIEVRDLPHEVDFELTQLEITPQQRSRGYWSHQLHKALQDKPKDYTTADLANFAGLIDVHFNNNQINPVDFYAVPQPATGSDSLEVLTSLLHMRNIGDEDEPQLKRLARAQLMALMLNVVSGKVAQTHEVSADGRTVSQAITYCDMLVSDEINPPDDGGPGQGSEWCRYIRANFILQKCNLGLSVEEGLIPENVLQIAYKMQQEDQLPEGFALNQNYPNPFNPTTEISFNLPNAGEVRLEVFNVMGQQVVTLVNGALEAGSHTVTWDSRDNTGDRVSSGVYFYRLESGDLIDTKKMVLLK